MPPWLANVMQNRATPVLATLAFAFVLGAILYAHAGRSVGTITIHSSDNLGVKKIESVPSR